MGAGCPGNVREMVELYYESLYRYAYRLSGSAADADDLTQEAFCKAQTQFASLRDRNRAKPWLFSIVRNLYLHRLRSERQHATVPLEAVAELPDDLPDDLPPIDGEQLQKALDELPEVFRTPVILFYFEEFSYREIADQMDLPIGTVMSRLARAKATLRQKLFPEAFAGGLELQQTGRATDGL